MNFRSINRSVAALTLLIATATAFGQSLQETTLATSQKTVDQATGYLKSKQKPDGGFQQSDREPPALAAMVMRILVQSPKEGPQSESVQKAVKYLLSFQKDDGGIYRDMIANYNTAIIVSALAQLNDPNLKPNLDKAIAYLKGNQYTEKTVTSRGDKIDPNGPYFGGWNYGGACAGMVDTSNTATVLEALKDAGLKQDDPAYQNAVKFISKLQNNSETNPSKWAGNDGGFIYNPGRNGEGMSSAGTTDAADGRKLPKSYGSMTYAGLKCFLYAGLTKADPKVKSAFGWIKNNWTVDENPGMADSRDGAQSGLYYYYHTFASALSAYDEPVITDAKGTTHDWRVELINKVASLQKPDGSFAGTKQWMEDNPMVATTLATLAVQEAMRDLKEHPAK